jgi:beta-N-acetylhexosaminidase
MVSQHSLHRQRSTGVISSLPKGVQRRKPHALDDAQRSPVVWLKFLWKRVILFNLSLAFSTFSSSRAKRRLPLPSLLALLLMFLADVAPGLAQVTTPVPTPQPNNSPAATDLLLQQAALDDAALTEQVEAQLARMTAADRVGQLFVVTFEGDDTSFTGDIARLIFDYRIGGVVLNPRKQNFSNARGVNTAQQVATLVNQLQGLAFGVRLPADQALTLPAAGVWPPPGLVALTSQSGAPPPNLPLLIGVEQWGDGLPYSALRRDFTPLPSEMALGATWNPDLARKVGQIVGRELQAVGVNLLLGPNLDVIDQPRADPVGALSLHAFGGNAYWVGQMGRTYIAGVHEGSGGRVATMARHFPGQGTIDRLPDQEIATVQLSLEELQRTALAPFRSVTRQPSILLSRTGDLYATDGLISSHMRYSALPGRDTPISLGPDLMMVLEQEGFAGWHTGGGVLMSNAIGLPAIRRYYDPTLQEFSPRRVALALFTAGHDLIYLDGLSLDGTWADEMAAMSEVVHFFQERYASDQDFAAQVDAAVRRVLRLKLRLYGPSYTTTPAFAPNNALTPTLPLTETAPLTVTESVSQALITAPQVLVSAEGLSVLTGTVRADALTVVGQVARDSLTVLYPDAQTLPAVLPTAPEVDDRLLIFTDSRLVQECQSCTAEVAVGPDEIANIIIRMYGSEATGQVQTENIVSQTFADLDQLLQQTALPAAPAQATPEITPTLTITTVATVADTTGEIDTGDTLTQTAEIPDKLARLEELIDQSNWLIFAMLDVDPQTAPTSDVVKRFLRQRSEQLRGKTIIVLALNAPNFLDATEISKITAYFGVYGKTRPFLENAVRALFRGYAPIGAPPVSVPGTAYDNLAERLQPAPERAVEVRLYLGENELVIQPDADMPPTVPVGAVLRVRVGPVLDYNGRSVPDGTPVNFNLIYEGEALALSIEPVMTRNGFAMREVPLDRTGTLRIAATVGEASTAAPILVAVHSTMPTTSTVPATLPVTGTTPLASLTTGVQLTPTDGTPSPPAEEPAADEGRLINAVTLTIALFTIVITLSLLLIAQIQILPRQVLVHNMLWATIFGLAAYILYGLGLLPGVTLLQRRLDVLGPAVVVFIAMLLPLLWLQLRTEQLQ